MILKHYFWLFIYFKMSFSQNISTTDSSEPLWVPRVINGWPAKLGDVPYQVAFKALLNRRKREYQTFCGGSIIAKTKLLSAAHCFHEHGGSCEKLMYPGQATKRSLDNKYAVAGNLNNIEVYRSDGPNGQWRTLHSVYYPKNYKFPKHDIAVAYTTKPFVFTEYISAIPMATQNTDYHGKCLVSGFGRIGEKAHEKSDCLLLAHLDIMPKGQCNRVHRKRMDDFVCTSSTPSDVGKGDSGGPLVCASTGDPNEKGKGVLVGVVSGHSRGRGSFCTRVSRYRRFVHKSKSSSVFEFKYSFKTYTGITLIYITILLF